MKIIQIYFWKRPILLTIGTGMQNCLLWLQVWAPDPGFCKFK